MRVDGSRLGKEKAADSKISDYAWTVPEFNQIINSQTNTKQTKARPSKKTAESAMQRTFPLWNEIKTMQWPFSFPRIARVTHPEELGTMFKNNLRGITFAIFIGDSLSYFDNLSPIPIYTLGWHCESKVYYYISKLVRTLWLVNLPGHTLPHGPLKFKAVAWFITKFSLLINFYSKLCAKAC